MKPIPDFAIFQNSRTKHSGVWNGERWAYPPAKDYDYLRLLAKLIRTDPDPVGIVKAIKNENK